MSAEATRGAPEAAPTAGKHTLVEQLQASMATIQAKQAAPGAQAPDDQSASAPASALSTGGGRALPGDVKASMERAFSADFSAVRIHEGPEAAAMGARAFTRGTDIFFAPGQYDPASEQGRELLGHELAHVVQQSQGRVQATAQAKGLAVNTDAGLEQEADAMGASAARGLSAGGAAGGAAAPSSQAPAQMKLEWPVVQRKGEVPLMDQVRRPGGPDPDPRVETLLQDMADYDGFTDGRPAQQLAALQMMIADAKAIVDSLPKPAKGLGSTMKGWFSKEEPPPPQLAETIYAVLRKEKAIVERQRDRLNRFTETPDSPYEQMTTEGLAWKHTGYEHNAKNQGATGKAYFRKLSQMNRGSMVDESMTEGDGGRPVAAERWFQDVMLRGVEALNGAVVNHYTTTTRAQTMVAGGQMKSKVMLEKDNPTFKHNTSVYDDLGLGNSGFLFFFIETPDAPMRNTRFAQGDEDATAARISIPIQESGLLEHGWIMLSDFAQREYPNLMTNEAGDRHTSWLPTRQEEQDEEGNQQFTQQVRHFEPMHAAPTDEDMEAVMDPDATSEQRQAILAVSPQVRGERNSKQVYSGPAGQLEMPERMFNNVLVGPDIIQGLAMRTALEVARIAKVNPGLAEQLKGLSGNALMRFMLKDLFRPQAMIPNTVAIRAEHVQQ